MTDNKKGVKNGPILENRFLRELAGSFSRHPEQINQLLESDAELLPLGKDSILALTTDSLVEEIHSGLYVDPFLIGWMTVMVNLSDLAAVGARPIGLNLIQHLPENLEPHFLRRLQQGIQAACREAPTYILGGDTNRSEHLQMGASAIGLIEDGRVITRFGCQPNDKLYTSGPFGLGNAFAYACFFTDVEPPAFQPRARLREGHLIRHYGSSCIDTSDGFLHAVGNLVEMNQHGFYIMHPPQCLLPNELQKLATTTGIPAWYFLAGPHGEFELLFTIPEQVEADFLSAAVSLSWEPIPLGRVVDAPGLSFIEDDTPRSVPLFKIINLFTECGGKPDEYLKMLGENTFYEKD